MFIEEKEYKPIAEFAKTYTKKNGDIGVTRAYIHQLISEEQTYPGTTGIDVLRIGKFYFVRNTATKPINCHVMAR